MLLPVSYYYSEGKRGPRHTLINEDEEESGEIELISFLDFDLRKTQEVAGIAGSRGASGPHPDDVAGHKQPFPEQSSFLLSYLLGFD